jgi:hypothetical protein
LKLSTLASVGTVMLQSSEVLFTHTPVGGLAPRMRAIHYYAHLTLSVHTLSSVTPSIALLPHNTEGTHWSRFWTFCNLRGKINTLHPDACPALHEYVLGMIKQVPAVWDFFAHMRTQYGLTDSQLLHFSIGSSGSSGFWHGIFPLHRPIMIPYVCPFSVMVRVTKVMVPPPYSPLMPLSNYPRKHASALIAVQVCSSVYVRSNSMPRRCPFSYLPPLCMPTHVTEGTRMRRRPTTCTADHELCHAAEWAEGTHITRRPTFCSRERRRGNFTRTTQQAVCRSALVLYLHSDVVRVRLAFRSC